MNQLNKISVIASLDWDWVTGDCGCGGCCGMCGPRAETTKRGRGSMKNLLREWRDRFEELKALPVPVGTPIFVAECHANISEVFYDFVAPTIVDYDSHCDRYNNNIIIDCANWVIHLETYGGIYFSQDEWDWKDKRMDAVFVCRSAPWTPKEMDDRFNELIWHLCFHAETVPKFLGHLRKSLRKAYISQFPELRTEL